APLEGGGAALGGGAQALAEIPAAVAFRLLARLALERPRQRVAIRTERGGEAARRERPLRGDRRGELLGASAHLRRRARLERTAPGREIGALEPAAGQEDLRRAIGAEPP